MCERGHWDPAAPVHQQRVCLRATCTAPWVCRALNKIICGFFSPSEFKAGPRFRLWGRGCSCAMEKKKRLFSCWGGLFGKTAALPTAASLQRALECSPLLSLSPSISPNKLLPLVLGSISPASPPPPPSHHSAAELWSGLPSGSWEMFSQGALNPPTHMSSKQSAPGSLTFQHFLHVFIISVKMPHGCRPLTKLKSASASGAACSPHTSWWHKYF